MKRPYLIVLLIAIAALSAVLVLPEISGIDETVRIRVANSIVTRGEVDIPFWEGFDDELLTVYVNKERGKAYGLWNVGQSLVLAPFVALSNPLREGVSDPVGKSLIQGAVVCIGYAMFVNVLLALATYAVLRQMRLSRKSATLGVLVLAVCTQWLVWGTSLQEESLCALLLMAALWCGFRASKSSQPWRWGVAMGACFGFLANVRFNGAFAAGAILIWAALMIPDRKRALMFAGAVIMAALPWAALLLWYNWARTGDAFFSPYQANYALMQAEAASKGQPFGYSFSLVRFSWMLFGLDNGAIWFALPLLLIPALSGNARLGVCLLLGALVLHAVLLSGFYAGVGVQGAGSPRYLGHQLIVLGPLAWLASRRAWVSRRRGLRYAVVCAFVISATLQFSAHLLNPELEASQDVNYEAAGDARPSPDLHLPRRFKNLWLAANDRLARYSYPATRGKNPGEARHTMLVILPAYYMYLDKYYPDAGTWRVPMRAGWGVAWLVLIVSGGWLGRLLLKPPFPKPQSR